MFMIQATGGQIILACGISKTHMSAPKNFWVVIITNILLVIEKASLWS